MSPAPYRNVTKVLFVFYLLVSAGFDVTASRPDLFTIITGRISSTPPHSEGAYDALSNTAASGASR